MCLIKSFTHLNVGDIEWILDQIMTLERQLLWHYWDAEKPLFILKGKFMQTTIVRLVIVQS